jgi:hypothetical protein
LRLKLACGECAPKLLAKGNAEAAIRRGGLWDEIARSYDVEFCVGRYGILLSVENSPIFQTICGELPAVRTG